MLLTDNALNAFAFHLMHDVEKATAQFVQQSCRNGGAFRPADAQDTIKLKERDYGVNGEIVEG